MAGAGYKLFNTGDVLTAAQVNTYLQEQVVMVFASATARTTALSGVLAEGMVSYLKDTNATEVYDGSAWVGIGNSGDITGVTAGTGLSGGGTSGDVTLSLSTPVSATNGGTAQTTYATGDLLYASAANTLAKRTIGSTGDVLTVSGGVPTWSAPSSGGGLTLLSTTSLSGTSTSISISASSYINLLVVFKGVYGSANNTVLSMRLNSDTGSNYNYIDWRRYPGSTAGDFQAGQNQSSQYMTSASLGTSSGASSFTGSMEIYRCNDTSQINYEFRIMGFNDSSVGSYQHTVGKYMASAAISNLTILNVVNSNTLSGTVYVYGVK